jgi:hypothetical protein
MSAYNTKDIQLLSEAYSVQLLKESVPTMTLNQVHANLELMSESEAQYICDVSERLLEAFGGFRALGGALKQGVGGALKSAGQAVGQGVGQAVQGAKNVGAGVSAAANQVGQNVKDIYQTQEVKGQSETAVKKAADLTQQLIDLVTQAQRNGLVKAQGSITDMTLADLVNELETAKQSAETFRQGARNTGLTGGAKQAFTQGRQAAQQATV